MKQRIISSTKEILILQGVLSVIFGLTAMIWPSITLVALAYLFAAFLLVDGSVLMILGFAWQRKGIPRQIWWGLLQFLLGLFVLYNPDLTIGVFIMILGITLMVRGIFNISHALWVPNEGMGKNTIHAIMGLFGIVIGAVIAVQPAVGGLAFVWILGLYAVATGSALIALAFGAGGKTAKKRSR